MATPLQKRKLIGEINVVPYIDVMLVLLVIFMVTAPLLTQGIEVELPKAGAAPIDDVPDHLPVVLSVDAAGNLYLDIGDYCRKALPQGPVQTTPLKRLSLGGLKFGRLLAPFSGQGTGKLFSGFGFSFR